MMLHMMRIFFTGGFRKPREVNWILGVLLLVLGMVEGFMGYSLPDDLLSGTGLRAVSAFILSIPVIGTWMHWAVFGGDYPGDIILPRFYSLHILLVPGIILALIGCTWHWCGSRSTPNSRPAGDREQRGRSAGAAHLRRQGRRFLRHRHRCDRHDGRLFQINPIWNLGPYNPSQVSAGVQPDFYMGFLDGMVRVWPAWEVRNLFGHYTLILGHRLDLRKLLAERPQGHLQVIIDLQVKPQLRSGAECLA